MNLQQEKEVSCLSGWGEPYLFDNAGFFSSARAAENGISSSETLVCWFGYIISRGNIDSGDWPLQ